MLFYLVAALLFIGVCWVCGKSLCRVYPGWGFVHYWDCPHRNHLELAPKLIYGYGISMAILEIAAAVILLTIRFAVVFFICLWHIWGALLSFAAGIAGCFALYMAMAQQDIRRAKGE